MNWAWRRVSFIVDVSTIKTYNSCCRRKEVQLVPVTVVDSERLVELAVGADSFFSQFATELVRINENSCNGDCTYDSDNVGSLTDHEST